MSQPVPTWAKQILEQVSAAVQFQGFATLEGRHTEAEATDWGVDLVQLAPALLDLVEAGPQDGTATV
jgi:hypothetical protein